MVLLSFFACSQNKELNDYKYRLKPAFGIKVVPKHPILGIDVGGNYQSPINHIGGNIHISYMLPKITLGNKYNDRPYLIYNFDFTYKILFIAEKPTFFGIGYERPTRTLNPIKECPYCFPNFLTFSIQQNLWDFYIQLKRSESIGSEYWGWYFTGHHQIYISIIYLL